MYMDSLYSDVNLFTGELRTCKKHASCNVVPSEMKYMNRKKLISSCFHRHLHKILTYS